MSKRNWIILLTAALAVAVIALVGILLTRERSDDPTPTASAAPTPTPYREILKPVGNVVPLTDDGSELTPDGQATEMPTTGAPPDPDTGTSEANATPSGAAQANTEYGYALLTQNAASLAEKYPDRLTRLTIGTTAFGREIVCLRIGNEQAEHKILLLAGVRGGEYGMSLVMMKQIETYLADTTSRFRGKTYQEVLDQACLYFVPMLNPDGVELCLHGMASVPEDKLGGVLAILQSDVEAGQITEIPAFSEGIRAWNANGSGVEVALNFGAGTVSFGTVFVQPSCALYPGTPFETSEAQAVRTLCDQTAFAVMAVYSGIGYTVDWSFGQNDGGLSYTMALGVSQSSSYAVVENGLRPDFCAAVEAHQWFIQTAEKPALKIASGKEIPYSPQEIVDAWRSLSAVPLYLADPSQWNFELQDDENTTPTPGAPDENATPMPDAPGFEYDELD
ncbi:MAG: hypothetical protein J6X30_05760 [Clostridia bacterium]|nr:hypothetical protein [Clostridia bacterium]